MDPIRKEKILDLFAKTIVPPSDEVIKDANVQMDKVFKLLQAKSKFSLDRFIVGGSAGKRTYTQSFDYDCVVFVNDKDEHPNFEDVISEFEEILNSNESLKIQMVKTTPFSLQFAVNDIEFDLLPAVNLIRESESAKRIQDQQLRVLQILDKSSYDTRARFEQMKKLFSSSLVETHVEFMKKQDAFAHELARLGKFWTKTLFFDSYINGKSTIIELIAVDAATKTVAKYKKPNFIEGFNLFLEQMGQLGSIKVTFEKYWPPVKNEGLIRGFKAPVILEPNNPYNNLGDSLGKDVIEKFQLYAKETIARMNKFANHYLANLFEPQPRTIVMKLPTPSKFVVEVLQDRKELTPKLIDRRQTKRTAGEIMLIKMIQDRVFTSTIAFTSRLEQHAKASEVQSYIQTVIDTNILNVPKREWASASTKEYESRHFTIVIPYTNQVQGTEQKEFVVVSFNL